MVEDRADRSLPPPLPAAALPEKLRSPGPCISAWMIVREDDSAGAEIGTIGDNLANWEIRRQECARTEIMRGSWTAARRPLG